MNKLLTAWPKPCLRPGYTFRSLQWNGSATSGRPLLNVASYRFHHRLEANNHGSRLTGLSTHPGIIRRFESTTPRPPEGPAKPIGQKVDLESTKSRPGTPKKDFFTRISPFSPKSDGDSSKYSSFRKIVALARPERRPLLIAIGLLLVSSMVSMSIPFSVGKLIDFFTSENPVSVSRLQDQIGVYHVLRIFISQNYFYTPVYSPWSFAMASVRVTVCRFYHWCSG